jgi:hypothetical protein
VPVVPEIISTLFGMYFLVVRMRLLGALYLSNKERLGWFH